MSRRHVSHLAALIILMSAGFAPAGHAATELVFADGFDGTFSYRIDSLTLHDPHVWANFIGCSDLTSQLNTSQQSALQDDSDQDGFLDASFVLRLLPLDQSDGAMEESDLAFGPSCYAPATSGICIAGGSTTFVTTYISQTSGTCLAPIAGTTRATYGALNSPGAPCFATAATTVNVSLSGIPLALHDTRVAATYSATPATNLTSGLLFGFVTQADADATILSASLPVIGGKPLSAVLAGGTNACPAFSDMDTNNAVAGWWFYFDFTATQVDYVP